MVERIEVICQKWHDTDQMAGVTLHLNLKEHRKYLQQIKSHNDDNALSYPHNPIGDVVKVEVYAKTLRKLRNQGTLVFGYDFIYPEALILEKVVKRVVG